MNGLTSATHKLIGKSLYTFASKSSSWGRRVEQTSCFYEIDEFPFLQKVLNKSDILVDEITQLLEQEANIPSFQDIAQLPKERRKTVVDENWKNLVFFLNGEQIVENLQLCPEIATVLKQDIPNVQTALLSILHGNTKIAEHKGEQNGLLRLHVPIIIPDGGECGLCVDGKSRNWSEEKAMIFDHAFLHSAWNDSNEIRVILIVDFERDLRFPWSKINQLAVKALAKTPYFKDVLERSRFSTNTDKDPIKHQSVM